MFRPVARLQDVVIERVGSISEFAGEGPLWSSGLDEDKCWWRFFSLQPRNGLLLSLSRKPGGDRGGQSRRRSGGITQSKAIWQQLLIECFLDIIGNPIRWHCALLIAAAPFLRESRRYPNKLFAFGRGCGSLGWYEMMPKRWGAPDPAAMANRPQLLGALQYCSVSKTLIGLLCGSVAARVKGGVVRPMVPASIRWCGGSTDAVPQFRRRLVDNHGWHGSWA